MWFRAVTFWIALNVAVTCWLVLIVSAHVKLLPLHPPVHPTKDEFAPAVSVSVTLVPIAKLALHVGAQLTPEGLLEIVPMPVPARLKVSTPSFWIALKFAVTCWLALSINVQVGPLPLHAPVHPAKDEFAPAASVSVTLVPLAKLALHVGAQLTPEGMLEIVPTPVPARLRVSTAAFWTALKFAVTCWLALSINVQVGFVPLQPPAHPAKDEFAPAVSVSVTWVPLAKAALHVVPQLMPAGLLLIIPPPAPAAWVLS